MPHETVDLKKATAVVAAKVKSVQKVGFLTLKCLTLWPQFKSM